VEQVRSKEVKTKDVRQYSSPAVRILQRSTSAPHVASANEYIRQVLAGEIPACKWVRLACQRQLDDLACAEQNDPAFPYRFDVEAAERICEFVELSPHVKGKKFAGQLMHLEPWECFIFTTVWGWLRRDACLRRFRRAYTEVAKGNGKSALTSPAANYMAFADGEPGAEVYSAATTRDQARIVFSVSQAMLRAMPEFCDRAGVEVCSHSINQVATNSFFRPLSSDANSVEGINPYFTGIDELHAHPSRDLYDNLDTANGKREGSLLWAITTAGSDRAGICYEQHRYVTKLLEGSARDDSYFGIIFTIDVDDDWAVVENIRKANPNWGVSVDPAEIGQKLQKALQLASAQPTFKTKHCNVWVNADHAWMDMQRFRKCADPSLREEDFVGEPCIIGLDLGNKLDILASLKLFWRDEEQLAIDGQDESRSKRHYFAFGTYFLPEATVEQAQNSQYQGWVIEQRIRTCPGEVNDFDQVEEAIRDDARRFDVREVAHDPWNAVEIVNHLQQEGLIMVEIAQVVKNLSEPMNELEAAVYDGRFHYDGDPVLEWAVSNVVAHRDRNDNLFPTKEKAEKKIDPVSALLNAMNRAMATAATEGGGVSVFGNCGKCGELCEGKLVGDSEVVVFDCGAHKS
jgi:phage terminase large subunit-like protein